MTLNCPVCAEKYKNPKVLSCGHTVCCRCLNSHITINVPMQGYDISEYLSTSEPLRQIPAKNEFTCPVNRCDKQNTPPEPERPTWTWADQFPNNLTIASLIDSSERNDTGPKNCDFCLEVGKHVVASGFCEDCVQALCSKCVYIHRLVRKGHNLETWSQYRLSNDAINEESNNSADKKCNDWMQQDKCPFHPMELANIFCKDHKAMCCIICSCTDHRSCSVSPVDALFSGECDNFNSESLSSRLAACSKNIMELVKDRLDTLDRFDDQKKTILTQLLSLKSVLQELMENMECKVTSKLKEIHAEIKREMEADMKRFEFLKETVSGTNARLQAEVHGQHHTKSIQMLLEIQKECGKIEEEIDTTTKKRNVFIQFTVEDQVEKMIKKIRQMEEKGAVMKTSFHLDPGRNFTKNEGKNTEKQQQSLQYVEKVLQVDAQIPSDTWPCWLTDCIFLHNRELLVVDNANTKIKHFSADYHYVGDLAVSAKPWGIAASSNGTVQQGAVTLPEAHKICILETVPNLKLVSEFNTPGACYGVGYLTDERLIVTCENNNKATLRIFSINGDEIGLIEKDEKIFSGLLCSMPRYLAVTKNNTIYISDTKLYQIKHASLEGNQESQFTDNKFIAPAGIALDHDENIIACGNGSLNVFWINKKINGESNQILTNLHLPRAIAFHPVENMFVITQDSGKFKSFLQFFILKGILSNDSFTVSSMLGDVSS